MHKNTWRTMSVVGSANRGGFHAMKHEQDARLESLINRDPNSGFAVGINDVSFGKEGWNFGYEVDFDGNACRLEEWDTHATEIIYQDHCNCLN